MNWIIAQNTCIIATDMSSQTAHTIDLVLPLTQEFGRRVLRGVSEWVRARPGYRLHGWTSPEAYRDAPISDKGSLGVIAMIADPAHVDWYARGVASVINCSNRADPGVIPFAQVINDDPAIGALAADHLLSRGFRRFAFVGYGNHRYSQLRGEAFAKKVSASGCDCAVLCESNWRGHRGSIKRYIDAIDQPVAILCANDRLARGVMEACELAGKRLPDQVAILGVDNDQMQCELASLPLSSVEIAAEKIGHRAAQRLVDIAAGRDGVEAPVLIEPTGVIIRKSTDLFSIPDPMVAEALRFVQQHIAEPIGVENLLEVVPLSRRMLERRFRKALGRSVGDEIRLQRITRAKDLLTSSDLSLGEIARFSGFGEPYYLSRVFKQQTGQTPRDFRKRHQLR